MCVTLGGIYNSLDNKLAESVNGTWDDGYIKVRSGFESFVTVQNYVP